MYIIFNLYNKSALVLRMTELRHGDYLSNFFHTCCFLLCDDVGLVSLHEFRGAGCGLLALGVD